MPDKRAKMSDNWLVATHLPNVTRLYFENVRHYLAQLFESLLSVLSNSKTEKKVIWLCDM